MSKSLGNFFLPQEIVEGSTTLFDKAYAPNVLRFFMMQSHYRSTLDLTQDALNASEKGLSRLTEAIETLKNIVASEKSSFDLVNIVSSFYDAMNDDFNAPILIAGLFDAVKKINLIKDGKESISQQDQKLLLKEMKGFALDVLGLMLDGNQKDNRLNPVMDLVLELRQQARENKDWTTSDLIRDGLKKSGISVKDGKDNTSWQ